MAPSGLYARLCHAFLVVFKPLSSHSMPTEWPRRDLEWDLTKFKILVSSRFLEKCLPSNKLNFVPFGDYF